MDLPYYLLAVGALLLSGCGSSAAPPADRLGAGANAAPATRPDAPAAPAAQFEPWGEAGCNMILKDRSTGGHTAWVQGSEYGMSLNTHLDDIGTLPHATELALRLRADGDPDREIVAKGQRGHDDSDSANFLSIILDQPQRQFIASAKRIAVMRGEAMLIELPVDTLADLGPIAAECTPGGPGTYVEE